MFEPCTCFNRLFWGIVIFCICIFIPSRSILFLFLFLSQAAADAASLRQEVARARVMANSTAASAIKQLNEQARRDKTKRNETDQGGLGERGLDRIRSDRIGSVERLLGCRVPRTGTV